MPREDVVVGAGTDTRRGYLSAVSDFCAAVDGLTVEAGGYLSMSTQVFLNGGKDPRVYGALGFVNCEILPQQPIWPWTTSCQTYLQALSNPGGKCSGETNADTKGGTWQVGNNAISYHALANKVPPKQDAINKLFRGSPLQTQSVNTGSGPPLSPWPLDSLKDIKAVSCHSHNDYERDIPLFSAMSAGCIGFEADVWYVAGNLYIGHVLPKLGRTLQAQYIQPLRDILDHNNNNNNNNGGGGGIAGGDKGVYPAHPSQSVVLMIDFKTSDSRTLDAVNAALQPLREGNYLSHVKDGEFVERQITVVASGSSDFDRINSGDGVPNRDIFYDAKVDSTSTRYNNLNSYYSSADFKDAIGNPGSVRDFSQAQREAVRTQVERAHEKGLKVRYYNLPGEYMWEALSELGVDRLNADDMYNTARLPRL
ncbi:PLC-like phosphodiesterase [Sarocladium implicatum]|nr:PLC-like phosphodiesterase [Sarocladium implicatum]